MEKLKPINYDDGTCKEYQKEIYRLKAVNKELIEALKRSRKHIQNLSVVGYNPVSSSVLDDIKQTIAKAEGNEEPPSKHRRIAIP